MKNLVKPVLFLSLFFVFSVVIQSCCTNTFKIIGAGTLSVYEPNTYARIDTITGPFLLYNDFELEYTDNLQSLGMIQSAYATSCAEEYLNSLDISKPIFILLEKKGTIRI